MINPNHNIMKNLFKFLLIAVVLVSLFSCTNNNEKLITENETINQNDLFLTNKNDVTNVRNDGGEEPDNGEE